MTDQLLNALGKAHAGLYKISFPRIDGVAVCRIDVSAASDPVYAKLDNDEHFYLRTGNSIKKLNARETVEYVKAHWGK